MRKSISKTALLYSFYGVSHALSQEFLKNILKTKPEKTIRYVDKDLHGFLLEYRPSGKGTWYLRYRCTSQGKFHYICIGTTQNLNAISARGHAYRISELISNGEQPEEAMEPTEKVNTTLKEFVFERYLPHIKFKKRSWHVDERILNTHVLPSLGKHTLLAIKPIDMLGWQNTLPQKGLQFTTCNRVLSAVKSMFNCAVQWSFLGVAQNPCKGLSAFPENTPRVRYLSKEEALVVLMELQSMGTNSSALALQLLLFTGARKSEILQAQWQHIHLEERVLTVPLSKSGKTRHIPLSDEALKIIQKIPRGTQSSWLFPAHGDASKHLTSLFYTWDKVRKKCNLENVRIHDLRHSFASLLINAGCSLYEVQKILGHCNPKMTMRYAHFAQSSLVEAANCVGESIFQTKKI